MGRLVQIHKIHIDILPWDIAVILRIDMKIRLLKRIEACDPCFGRRKRMHPRDHAGTAVIRIRRAEQIQNLL